MARDPLTAEQLCWRCDASRFGFETTDELDDFDSYIGQERAVEAIHFGLGMPKNGYNIYALGPQGLHKHSVVRHFLEGQAAKKATPPDRCYVNNFDEPYKPHVIALPAGQGAAFKADMDGLVEELTDALRAAFESDEYRTRRQMIEQELKETQERAISEIEHEARERSIALQRTPAGLAFAPMREGRVMSPDEFHKLSQEERHHIQQEVENLQEKLQERLQNMPEWIKQTREKLRELNQETASYAVDHLIDALKRKYEDQEEVVAHLDAVRSDIIENVRTILSAAQSGEHQGQGGGGLQALLGGGGQDSSTLLRRYQVNLIVDNAKTGAAPVVYEDEPTYDRLLGRVEHRAEMGALTTDFHLIRPGAMHRANGGYLMLDARRVLTRPLAWQGLKRALLAGEIRVESPYQHLGLLSTVTLEPAPIPLDLKVVLVGERLIYYLLSELDPDFRELFKVAADFDERTDRSDEALDTYARMVGTLARRDDLKPFHREGVARVLEHCVRLAGDTEKLSTELDSIADLLRESDYWARRNGNSAVGADDVAHAIASHERRHDRVRERIQEEIRRGTILIDTEGSRAGQVNALSVMSLGGFAFARPNRVTARVRLGRGQLVDIEREVELGGPIHSKGVLILGGYLGERYSPDRPLTLSASLVFEQSYGGIEGDSASAAELFALLSAIAGAPLRQDFAITGSINQHGQIQPIGGVNEKIEGFYDVCAARGLTGEQAVIVPASNVKHLVLHERVRRAVDEGKFAIYAIETADQGIELLTGMTAGERDAEGSFPEDSFNARVERRLAELAEKAQAYAGRLGGLGDERPGGG